MLPKVGRDLPELQKLQWTVQSIACHDVRQSIGVCNLMVAFPCIEGIDLNAVKAQ